ncbi:MAG: histidinol-phosphate transaminase [Anaerolineae bacterium]|nr:histidinol-phosphate transaminase [Anaerolineae bacterium]
MEEYTPIVPFEVLSRRLGLPPDRIVKLDANENPYGPAPSVYRALAECRRYNIYPDPEQTLLREAIEPYLGLSREHVVFGNGSDELIDLTMRLFVFPGDAVVNLPPTFGMYPYNTSLCAGRLVDVPRRQDFSVDVAGVERAVAAGGAKMLFINSPNNPDGSLIAREDLERLLHLPVIVVLDEAYAEFSGESFVSWVPEHWNLVVLRTFSKWAALGGLRIGYGVYPIPIAAQLWKIKPPYSINVAAQEAALVSLAERDYLMANVSRIVAERERFRDLLSALPGVHPYPSRSNFILCRVHGVPSVALKQHLERQGVLVRYYNKPGLTDCIRISVGRPEQNEVAILALRQALAELATTEASQE